MCGGGGDAPEVKPSSQEIIAAKEAVDKRNERTADGYVGLERDAITDANTNHQQSLRVFGSAELATGEAEAYQLAGATRSSLQFGDIGNAAAQSVAALNSGARQQGLAIRDAKKMGVIRTGQDMSNNATDAMMLSARNGLRESLAGLNAELSEQEARYKNISNVVQTGASIAGHYFGKQETLEPNIVNAGYGAEDNPYKDLRPLSYDELRGARSNTYGLGNGSYDWS